MSTDRMRQKEAPPEELEEDLKPGDDIEIVERPEEDPAVAVSGDKQAGDDPLEALKRQFSEAQEQREAEKRRADAAEARAREQAEQLDRHATTEITHHKAVLEQAYNTEELKAKDAKKRYAEALRNGDYDAAADAQEELIRSNGIMAQYAGAYQELERREKEPKPKPERQEQKQPSQDEQFDAALKQMHPAVAAWVREHKDDVLNPERQKLARAADQMAVARGLKPGSDEYLDYMDEQMGYGATDDGGEEPAPKQKAAPVQSRRAPAAPPSRTSGSSAGRRRVHLSEDDKRQIDNYRSMGMNVTEKEYAQWKLKAEQEGALNGGQRQMLRFKAVAE